ncbi:hypothetical protein SCHPADRAFT_878033 [Schizopora paradoxa]|uniref:Uncharacterized protein n=1 Tax=Schizopora paradoxa TaxID=27342 RepID=A0A0H2RM85_9AGAM|nr:hypothetical protein SCHPADRAFT_878033 [Schizopora paradoxa]
MGGPGLEVFKFAMYLALPIGVMVHYGKPEWYTQHVLPYRDRIFPPLEKTNRNLPVDQSVLRDELARIKAEKLARKLERDREGSSSS